MRPKTIKTVSIILAVALIVSLLYSFIATLTA